MEKIAIVIATVLGFSAALIPVAVGFYHQHTAKPEATPAA
jgi:hypothetical protein